ncbi:hypothetical protein FNF29_08442 [Cafeteria roenbergensis]|uniref:Uncharacterized protein n=1 Tax=Cafeteria roenbergensis TaxID=33653 RepID=A0A5A8C0S9_CAFRO|nr:hypothetical protein FNF29_08442 [Cafeteria roenbergensis]|eukprot:KAA0145670.1 hypothetical protein FNF29_08442 [Cafeteria roenbergensis]
MRSVASQQSSAWLYSFERKLSFLFGLEDDLLGDYHSSRDRLHDLTMTLASPVSMRTGYVEEACDFWDRMECIIDPQGAACSTADFQH